MVQGRKKRMMAQEIKREISLWSFSVLNKNQGFYILTKKEAMGGKNL